MSFSTINISISNEKDFSNVVRVEKVFCKMRKSFFAILPLTCVKVYITVALHPHPCSLKRLQCFFESFHFSHLNRVKANVHYMKRFPSLTVKWDPFCTILCYFVVYELVWLSMCVMKGHFADFLWEAKTIRKSDERKIFAGILKIF
jgi:hypothetical protein